MSIFVRPDSPPPRQPSPDITPAPLPYPHHPRRVASQPKIRVYSPSLPPGLQSPSKTVQPARSYDHITKAHSDSDHNSSMTPKRTSRIQQPLPPHSGPELNSRHRSTLTVAVPRRSSSLHVSPVANPPLPSASTASVSSSSKRTLRPQPNSFDSWMAANALPQRKPPSKPVLPPLEKHKSLGIACLRFFRFRNSSSRYSQKVTTI
jgi:hypothetical protein